MSRSDTITCNDCSHLHVLQAGLQDILARPLEFHGTFAASLSYADAPNPCLSVGDVGVVGLPLGSLYAHAIKESYSHSTSLIPVSMSGSDVRTLTMRTGTETDCTERFPL